AQVAEMFAQVGRRLSADQAIEEARGLLVDPAATPLFGPDDGTFTFRSVGNRTLETSERGGKPGDARYFDGELDIYYSAANKQADLNAANESVRGYTTLWDFCLFFRLAGFERLENLGVTELADGLSHVKFGASEQIVDKQGFVYSWRVELRDPPVN